MRRSRPRSPRLPAARLLGPCLLGAVALGGCTALWSGDWEEAGHRRIYLYEVQPGDTLNRIAWRHGLEPGQLQAWNSIDRPRQLQVGRHLMLNPPEDFANDPSSGGVPSQAASSRGSGSSGGSGADSASSAGGSASADGGSSAPPADLPDSGIDWRWPAEGEVIRSYATDSGGKSGIQIGGEPGRPVRAAADGEVVYSGDGLRGYGNLVIVMHDERFLSAYGYNRELLVSEGDRVAAGDRIAEMGRAAGAERASLHFEIRIDGKAIDPKAYLPPRKG